MPSALACCSSFLSRNWPRAGPSSRTTASSDSSRSCVSSRSLSTDVIDLVIDVSLSELMSASPLIVVSLKINRQTMPPYQALKRSGPEPTDSRVKRPADLLQPPDRCLQQATGSGALL